METLFSLDFSIVTGADARNANPFLGNGSDRLIVSVDTLAGESMFRCLQHPDVEPYDLVIFDEAHKLAARRERDMRPDKTERYKLAEALTGVRNDDHRRLLTWGCRHLLLLTATPHMGRDDQYFFLWRLLEPEALSTEEAFRTYPPAAARPILGSVSLSGGEDGFSDIDDIDFIGDSASHTGLYAFDSIEDLNILLVPGVTTAGVVQAGIAYAESRKDILFIAEAPVYLEPLEVVDFRKGQNMFTHAAFNSSYGALYYPWIEVSDPLTGKRKLVPPTGAVAGCIARSDEKTDVWYAPAGIDRGRVFNALSLCYKTSRGERDVLYAAGINVIASFPDTGINIWGQKTLQSQPSATDRINVRRLMMYVEEAIAQSSRFVVFEPNNSQTWRALVRLITPFLTNIKGKGGFYDFRVQCDSETNTAQMIDTNQLVARVFVKPTKTAEFVELNFILTATGADFREIF